MSSKKIISDEKLTKTTKEQLDELLETISKIVREAEKEKCPAKKVSEAQQQ